MTRPIHGLQETNDRFLANIQRNGTFSVVPRVPAGEITPEEINPHREGGEEVSALHEDYGRSANRHVWGEEAAAFADLEGAGGWGMESGHAYAKSLRTVKSCVGTSWCRFGIGDSVGMAVRLEER
ncbi:hypothetical protein DID88_003929 [Monilinia fructigena]|uniref:Uncharacterized protein n=1 Tax=Monilinia fructigena TaxID=38457 RepID=A0A395IYV0_9HELO|nr:hypothetical protein DID88_003929 [Monilinia fructigena]